MLILAASAFLATVVGYSIVVVLFPTLGLLDFPQRYGLQRSRLPYPAGIVAVAIFVLFFAMTRDIGMQEMGILAGIAILAATSFLDDRTPLSPKLRLFVQLIVACLIFSTGSRIYSITSPFGGLVKLDTIVLHTTFFGALPFWSGVFTICWLLLTMNALNWFDGIPGQVSVISAIGFLLLGLLAYFRNGETDTATVAFVLSAIAAAGIFFDFPPGRLLLGDTGSMFFGLMLGLLGVFSGGKVATAFLALGIPLLDAALVIVRRLLRGTSPLRGGKDHLHHLLLERGWGKRTIVVFFAGIGSIFGATALFLSTEQKGVAFLLLLLLILVVTKYASGKSGR